MKRRLSSPIHEFARVPGGLAHPARTQVVFVSAGAAAPFLSWRQQ